MTMDTEMIAGGTEVEEDQEVVKKIALQCLGLLNFIYATYFIYAIK